MRELHEGSHFGESALLSPGSKSDFAVIASYDTCVVHYLTKRSYDEIAANHADFPRLLHKVAQLSQTLHQRLHPPHARYARYAHFLVAFVPPVSHVTGCRVVADALEHAHLRRHRGAALQALLIAGAWRQPSHPCNRHVTVM